PRRPSLALLFVTRGRQQDDPAVCCGTSRSLPPDARRHPARRVWPLRPQADSSVRSGGGRSVLAGAANADPTTTRAGPGAVREVWSIGEVKAVRVGQVRSSKSLKRRRPEVKTEEP